MNALPKVNTYSSWYTVLFDKCLHATLSMVFYVYFKYIDPHTISVEEGNNGNYQTLKIIVQGDLNTLSPIQKLAILNAIQKWEGPRNYRYLSNRVQVLPRQMNSQYYLAAFGLRGNGRVPFISMAKDVYYPINSGSGGVSYELDPSSQKYKYTLETDDSSPPEVIDCAIDDILTALKIRGR